MRPWLVPIAVSFLACTSGTPAGSDPEQASTVGFHIEPANANLTGTGSPSASFQFEARSNQGEPVPVLWRLSNPTIGTINGNGVFSPCYGGGTTRLRALLQADTSKVASTSVTVMQQAFAVISIFALTNPADASYARVDSVAGVIDVHVNIQAGALACNTVVGSRL
ncbi:MAG TPA: hypothetical protein VJK71_08720, partial [Gemmatimonadales bacterium]|nr:hypothetical protein [Gemmatimonadales bacterium]